MSSTGKDRYVARRAVLLSLGGVIVGSAISGLDAGASAASRRRGPATRPAAAPHTDIAEMPAGGSRSTMSGAATSSAATSRAVTTSATTAPVHHTQISTRLPGWAHHWNAPIYDLDDFLRRDHKAHFPRRSIMLTIDDGPSPEWTPKYLRLLDRHHVKATFNVIGEQVRPHRNIVKAVASEGHVIANHTWTHDEALPTRTPARIHREIAHTNEVIHDATGYAPAQFRAPGGVWGPRVFAELAKQHMMPIGWDIDPRDWALPGTGAIESAMRQAGPGDIVLCHDGGGDRSETFAALQTVIPELLHRGLHFVTLPARKPVVHKH